MEGRGFLLLPDFTPRPVPTDNNLSAVPADYQQYIIDRYRAAGVPLLDANSGFEPKTFDEDVFEWWWPIIRDCVGLHQRQRAPGEAHRRSSGYQRTIGLHTIHAAISRTG